MESALLGVDFLFLTAYALPKLAFGTAVRLLLLFGFLGYGGDVVKPLYKRRAVHSLKPVYTCRHAARRLSASFALLWGAVRVKVHPLCLQLLGYLPYQCRPVLQQRPVFVLVAQHCPVVPAAHAHGAVADGYAVCLGAEHRTEQGMYLLLGKRHERTRVKSCSAEIPFLYAGIVIVSYAVWLSPRLFRHRLKHAFKRSPSAHALFYLRKEQCVLLLFPACAATLYIGHIKLPPSMFVAAIISHVSAVHT